MALTGEVSSEGRIAEAIVRGFRPLRRPVDRLVSLLAIAVSATETELRSVYGDLWPKDRLKPEDVQAFLSLALIERVRGRLRVISPADVYLAREFRTGEPTAYERANALFAEFERARSDEEAQGDEIDRWQITARLAYYLQAFQPAESAASYARAFDQAPGRSRAACRLWLADLAIRYESVSESSSRTTRFFQGFRFYVAEDRRAAASVFRELLTEESADPIAAIAAHLLANCMSIQEADDRLTLLQQSVGLSAALGLRENELMARNSLVWLLVTVARRGGPASPLAAAVSAASDNDWLADQLGNPGYITATRYARAMTTWYSRVGLGLDLVSELESHSAEAERVALPLLKEAEDYAQAAHDLGSWVQAAVGAAGVYRKLGRFGEALDELWAAIEQVQRAADYGELPVRQFLDETDRLEGAITKTGRTAEHQSRLDAARRAFLRAARLRGR